MRLFKLIKYFNILKSNLGKINIQYHQFHHFRFKWFYLNFSLNYPHIIELIHNSTIAISKQHLNETLASKHLLL